MGWLFIKNLVLLFQELFFTDGSVIKKINHNGFSTNLFYPPRGVSEEEIEDELWYVNDEVKNNTPDNYFTTNNIGYGYGIPSEERYYERYSSGENAMKYGLFGGVQSDYPIDSVTSSIGHHYDYMKYRLLCVE